MPPIDGSAGPNLWRRLTGGSSRAASQRLAASLETFETDLEYRLNKEHGLRDSKWHDAVQTSLDQAHSHHQRGEIDAAWRCFNAAARLELDKAGTAELRSRAQALRREAASGKLASSWRSDAIGELLDTKEIDDKLPAHIDAVRWRVSEATRLRDEDADNRYYGVALVRGQRTLLLLVLVGCIAIILALAAAVDWKGDLDDPSVGFVALVAGFGALGACLSAIRSLGHASAGTRIPEHVASSLMTVARPTLGAAAALGVYVIAASGLLNISLEDEQAHLTILALGFAAGFSERFVLSAVGAASGAVNRKEKD